MFSLAILGVLFQSVLDFRLESFFWQRRNELDQGQEEQQRNLESTPVIIQNSTIAAKIQNSTIAAKNASTVFISNDYNKTVVRVEEKSTKDNRHEDDDVWITINGWRFQPNRLPFPPTIRGDSSNDSLNMIVDQYRHDWKAKNFTEEQRRQHPYRAAKDEFGNFGYIADA